MTVTWNIRPEDMWPRQVQAQVDAIEAEIVALIDGLADEVGEWMRANHPWQNRTGAAEAGLYADIEYIVHQTVTLLMSHGPTIEYALFLELAHAGRWAILPDTVDHFGPVIFRGVQEIVRRRMGH